MHKLKRRRRTFRSSRLSRGNYCFRIGSYGSNRSDSDIIKNYDGPSLSDISGNVKIVASKKSNEELYVI